MQLNEEQEEDSVNSVTPEEHADYIIKRLEHFIRSGKSVSEGMSFKKWQQMAKVEIIKSILQIKSETKKETSNSSLFIFSSAAVMVTIGFWGAAVSSGKIELLTFALICFSFGVSILLVTFWQRYKVYKSKKAKIERNYSLKRIESLNRRIKKLEREIEIEKKDREKQLEKIRDSSNSSLNNLCLH